MGGSAARVVQFGAFGDVVGVAGGDPAIGQVHLAGAELAHAEAQLDLSQKIGRADERIERSNSSSASNEVILERLKKHVVRRDY